MNNKELPSVHHTKSFNLLENFLKSDNRKMHFFFVDYESNNEKDDKNKLTQAQYLNAAAAYFNLPENNYFKKSTDAIYIVLTKSDLMHGENKIEQLNSYLYNNNYNSLVQSLKSKCKDYHINGGKLLATHFSLGEVFFKHYCKFNAETSLNMIDIFKRRISQSQNSILNVFNQ